MVERSRNDFRDYLAHHGVQGMRWGIRRYQPYGKGGYNPKSTIVRRYQNEKGKLTKKGAKQWNKLAREDRTILSKSNIVDGTDSVLKKSTKFQRVTWNEENIDDRIKYMTLKDEPGDSQNYVRGARFLIDAGNKEPGSLRIEEYESTRDLKVVTGKQVVNDLMNKYGDELAINYRTSFQSNPIGDRVWKDVGNMKIRELYAEVDDVNSILANKPYYVKYKNNAERIVNERAEAIHNYVSGFMQSKFDRKNTELQKYKELGYDAVADIFDISQGFSKQPIILLNTKDTIRKTDSKLIG